MYSLSCWTEAEAWPNWNLEFKELEFSFSEELFPAIHSNLLCRTPAQKDFLPRLRDYRGYGSSFQENIWIKRGKFRNKEENLAPLRFCAKQKPAQTAALWLFHPNKKKKNKNPSALVPLRQTHPNPYQAVQIHKTPIGSKKLCIVKNAIPAI